MQVRIPYLFDVTGIERKHRNPSSLVFADWAWTELAEATADEAPVAVRWTAGYGDRARQAETRWHDGRHWMRWSEGNAVPASALEGPDEDLVCKLLGYSHSTHRKAVEDFMRDGRPSFDPDGFREIHEVKREEGLARTLKTMRRRLSVDGEIYQQVPEPRYIVTFRDMRGGEQRPSAFASIETGDRFEPSPYSSAHFRADRLDDLKDYVRGRGERHVIRHVDPVEVLQPQSLLFDDEAYTLLSACRRITGAYRSGDCFELLRTMDREPAAAWFAIRDAVAGGDGMDEDALQELADHLSAFSEGLPEDSRELRSARDTLARWALRPLVAHPSGPGM